MWYWRGIFPFSSSQYLIILKLRDYCYRILSYFIVSSQQQGTLIGNHLLTLCQNWGLRYKLCSPCSGGHGFDCCRPGLRFFLCPTLAYARVVFINSPFTFHYRVQNSPSSFTYQDPMRLDVLEGFMTTAKTEAFKQALYTSHARFRAFYCGQVKRWKKRDHVLIFQPTGGGRHEALRNVSQDWFRKWYTNNNNNGP